MLMPRDYYHKRVVCLDNETHLIGKPEIVPKVVCCGAAWRAFDDSDTPEIVTQGVTLADTTHHRSMYSLWAQCLKQAAAGDMLIVCHNAVFDLSTVAKQWPDLVPLIYDAYEAEGITCTKIREQLLNLSTHGRIRLIPLPNGEWGVTRYTLEALVAKYIPEVDMGDAKSAEDAWRLNFKMLDGVVWDDYPDDAKWYVQADPAWTLKVWEAQRDRAREGDGSLETEFFRAAAAYALNNMTTQGMLIDQERAEMVRKAVMEELDEEHTGQLIEEGILRPPVPPRPYKSNPNRMTKAKKASIDTKALKARVVALCKEHDIEVKETATGRVSTSKDTMAELADLDPVLSQYQHRQAIVKLIDTEIPRLTQKSPDGRIRPGFNALVETGRTSSSQTRLFPSFNGQNVDPRVRGCFVPSSGYVFCSCDYSANELVCLAQTLLDLFGKSTLAELIQNGGDAHAFLGAQLYYAHDEDFREGVLEMHPEPTRMDIYQCFQELKGIPDFKTYRTMAKPTGLGYPGGLGPQTFVKFAKGTYNQCFSLEQAKTLRDIWFQVFPVMHDYFSWVQDQTDDRNEGKLVYNSPFGMVRRGCSFTKLANGKALQTPAAEGGLMAVWLIDRACNDPTQQSILYGARPLLWIHDEMFMELNEDKAAEQAAEVSKLMVQGMQSVIRDLPVKADPVLMDRWDKYAKPTYDDNGNLIVTEVE